MKAVSRIAGFLCLGAIAFGSSGCLLAIAGAVELSKPPIGKPSPPSTPAASPMAPSPMAPEEVFGTDGTYGWRAGSSAPADEVRQTAQASVRSGCGIVYAVDTEVIASCAGVRVLSRHDEASVYRLCDGSVERGQCTATWSAIASHK